MQREIKFRAWDIDGRTMVYGDVARNCIPLAEINPEITVMQYTGLKDKNGKEIYEGDIVQDTYEIKEEEIKLFKQEVFWCKEAAGFCVRPSSPFAYVGLTTSEHKEVIGNIYENKELLK